MRVSSILLNVSMTMVFVHVLNRAGIIHNIYKYQELHSHRIACSFSLLYTRFSIPYYSDALEIFILAAQLQQGDHFPSLSFKLLSGGSLTLPEDITTRYAAVLFYRGHW